MTSFRYRASDPEFFRRFCRHQLVMMPTIWLLSFAINQQVIPRAESVSRGSDVAVTLAQYSDGQYSDGQYSDGQDNDVRDSESVGVAVLPQGWRRTANGWEHTAEWEGNGLVRIDPSRSMRAHLAAERTREHSFADQAVEKMRETSPVVIAICQMILIGGIWYLCPKRQGRKGTEVSQAVGS